jgi:hypothetical protein
VRRNVRRWYFAFRIDCFHDCFGEINNEREVGLARLLQCADQLFVRFD